MKKLRQSNIELLRIISMLLVLMVHADFFSLGIPSHDLMLASPGQFTFRVLVEFLSILCVDIFVVSSPDGSPFAFRCVAVATIFGNASISRLEYMQ